jgi:hypothetical protein
MAPGAEPRVAQGAPRPGEPAANGARPLPFAGGGPNAAQAPHGIAEQARPGAPGASAQFANARPQPNNGVPRPPQAAGVNPNTFAQHGAAALAAGQQTAADTRHEPAWNQPHTPMAMQAQQPQEHGVPHPAENPSMAARAPQQAGREANALPHAPAPGAQQQQQARAAEYRQQEAQQAPREEARPQLQAAQQQALPQAQPRQEYHPQQAQQAPRQEPRPQPQAQPRQEYHPQQAQQAPREEPRPQPQAQPRQEYHPQQAQQAPRQEFHPQPAQQPRPEPHPPQQAQQPRPQPQPHQEQHSNNGGHEEHRKG